MAVRALLSSHAFYRVKLKIKLKQERLERPVISSLRCTCVSETACDNICCDVIWSDHCFPTRCRYMLVSTCAAVHNHVFPLTPAHWKTFFKCSARVNKAIYHQRRAWQELIAEQFILVYTEARQSARGEKAKQLTTAVARSAPREVQLRTSVSTPNTIILQGHKATARSVCNNHLIKRSQDVLAW